MESYEDEVRRRRERGRLSQARFRKKQAQEWKETREENMKMKAALESIVRAAQRGNEPCIINAVRTAADVAGIDASGLGERVYKGVAREIADCETNAIIAASPNSLQLETSRRADQTEDGDSSDTPFGPENSVNFPENHDDGRHWQCSTTTLTSRSQLLQSAHLDPRLDCVRFSPSPGPLQASPPPRRIQHTFIGQLYYACTNYFIALCNLVTEPYAVTPWFEDQPNPYPSQKEAENRLWSLMQHSVPLNGVCRARALAEAHREFLDTVYTEDDCNADMRRIDIQLRRLFEADLESRGFTSGTWMTIHGLEGHVRRRLGSEAFSRLEQAIEYYNTNPRRTAAENSEACAEVRLIVRLLIRNLAESYCCFGDGPCWRVDSISALFSEMSL
ncbi:hypothetical protein F4861DRAFT_277298 [Xylaria intraflava]|nr:hypothetical protein F4861DRAFT_277298 [Xylaria intraflava]